MQWDIMRRAFGTGGATLVLIGDPKQAIYAFRGADVFAYLDAAEQAASESTLAVNWRSDRRLIDAYDALFANCQLGHEGIAYRTVRPAPANADRRLVGAPDETALRFRIVHRADGLVPTTKMGYASLNPARDAHRQGPRGRRRTAALLGSRDRRPPAGRIRDRTGAGTTRPRRRARAHQLPRDDGARRSAGGGCTGRDRRRRQRVRHRTGRRVAARARRPREAHRTRPRRLGSTHLVHRLGPGEGRHRRRRGVGGPALVTAPLGGDTSPAWGRQPARERHGHPPAAGTRARPSQRRALHDGPAPHRTASARRRHVGRPGLDGAHGLAPAAHQRSGPGLG